MSLDRDQLVRAFPNQPLLVAAFEELDQLIADARTTLSQLQAELATVQEQHSGDVRWQPASDLLTNIAGLEGQAGAVVINGGSDVAAQPVDTSDDASLLSKSRADTLYAPHP